MTTSPATDTSVMTSHESFDWEVFDMAHDHRFCIDENHGAEFGPMTRTDALAMQARNPRGYWARQIPGRAPAPTSDTL